MFELVDSSQKSGEQEIQTEVRSQRPETKMTNQNANLLTFALPFPFLFLLFAFCRVD